MSQDAEQSASCTLRPVGADDRPRDAAHVRTLPGAVAWGGDRVHMQLRVHLLCRLRAGSGLALPQLRWRAAAPAAAHRDAAPAS